MKTGIIPSAGTLYRADTISCHPTSFRDQPENSRLFNPLKCSGIRWLHLEVFRAIQV